MSNETADLQMFNSALEKALVAECDSQRARIERLEAAQEAADYYIGRLERCHAGRTVTDLCEAEVAYTRLRKAALARKEG